MDFINPSLDNIDTLREYLGSLNIRNCAFGIANNILWSRLYETVYTIIDDMMVFVGKEEGHPSSFTFPIKKNLSYQDSLKDEDYLKEAKKVFDRMVSYFEENSSVPVIAECTGAQADIIDSWYPGMYTREENRDGSDYIYLSEKLANLSGSKLHGKRNHINSFLKSHPDYIYEDVTEDNIDGCLYVARRWVHNNYGPDRELDMEHRYEYDIIKYSLEHMKELNMIGGLVKVDNIPAAFTLGEELTKDTFDVHFEKADDTIRGIYPMINREFVSRRLMDYTYINREEDMGIEGLRKSKLSYCPAILFEKFIVRKCM